MGGAAIAVSVVLFFVDKLVPDKDLAEGLRNALDIAGQAAPWVVVAVLAVLVVYLFRQVRNLVAALDATHRGQGEADEKMRQLEAALKKAKEAANATSAPSSKSATTLPERKWASICKGGVVRAAVPNSELETMYGRAIAALRERGLQGWLTWLEVFVYPYTGGPNPVSIALSLYSDQTGREYSFWLEGDGQFREDDVAKLSPRRPPMFKELPWREQPKWCEMLNLAAERVGPLVPHHLANLTIMTSPPSPPLRWSINVDDHGAGRGAQFEGSSPGDLEERAP